MLCCIMTEILINDPSYQPTLQIEFTKYSNQTDLENNCKASMTGPIIEIFEFGLS